MSRPWHPSPFLWCFAVAHLGAVGVLIANWHYWPQALIGLMVLHAIATFAGLWPKSRLLGPNCLRLPDEATRKKHLALTFDDGPDPEITPAVLDLLARHGARATFFCIGARAARHPEIVARIVAEGHAVENHSQHHRHIFSLFGPSRMAAEIAAAQTTLTALSGTPPRFFRAPAGLRNLFLAPILCRLGLHLTTWTRRGFDTREADPAKVLTRLTQNLAAGDILLLHDGSSARDAAGQPVVLTVLPALLATIADKGLVSIPLPEALPPADHE
ncbi:MAG: polysaccharide deacetylase family protein [Zoogloeaceae bacterium]|jgi:peptidoglycan/xylan/chitin deacetylase (PgdA/CDA1 family)|nr:polysaccharide deacetylase family protein [Zoogloeaceae bacterium]